MTAGLSALVVVTLLVASARAFWYFWYGPGYRSYRAPTRPKARRAVPHESLTEAQRRHRRRRQ